MRKWLLRLLAFMVAVGVVFLVLCFNPTFQRKLVLDLMKKNLGNGTVRTVKVGLKGVLIKDLQLTTEDYHIKLAKLEVKWKPLVSIAKRALVIDLLDINQLQVNSGLTPLLNSDETTNIENKVELVPAHVDSQSHTAVKSLNHIAHTTVKPEKEKRVLKFEGLMPKYLFTHWVQIKTLMCGIQTQFQSTHKIILALDGHDIVPNTNSTINLNIAFKDYDPHAQVDRIKGKGTIYLNDSGANNYSIETVLDLIASGQSLKSPLEAKLVVHADKTGAEEHYEANVYSILDGKDQTLIASVNGTCLVSEGVLKGTTYIQANREQILPFAFGAPLPYFQSLLKGAYTFDFHTASGSVQINTHANLYDLGPISKQLALFDESTITGDISVNFKPNVLDVSALNLNMSDKEGLSLVDIQLQKPFIIADQKINTDGDLIHFSIKNLPLGESLSMATGLKTQIGSVSADYMLAALSPDELLLTSVKPLSIENLQVSDDQHDFIKAISTFLDAQIRVKLKKSINCVLNFIKIKDAVSNLIDGNAQLMISCTDKKTYISYNHSLLANINAFSNQPLFGKVNNGAVNTCLYLKNDFQSTINKTCDQLKIDQLSICGFEKIPVEGTSPCLEILLRKPIDVKIKDLNKILEVEYKDLAEIRFNSFDLNICDTLIPNLKLGTTKIDGRWNIHSGTKDLLNKKFKGISLVVDEKNPLKITDFNLNYDNNQYLKRINIKCLPSVFYNSERAEVKITNLEIQDSQQKSLLKANCEILGDVTGKTLIPELKISTLIDLNVCKQQPVLEKFSNLKGGSIQFTANSNELESNNRSLDISAELENIQTNQSTINLDTASFKLTSTLKNLNELTFSCPFEIKSSRAQTDLKIEGWAKHSKQLPLSFDVRVYGKQISLEDVLLLSNALTPVSPADAKKPTVTQIKHPHSQPPAANVPKTAMTPAQETMHIPQTIWGNVNGKADIALDMLVYDTYKVTDLKTVLNIRPDYIELNPCSAYFAGAPFTTNLKLIYKDQIYAMDGMISLKDFDAGKLLKEINLNKNQSLEGIINLSGTIQGKGIDIDDLLQKFTGNFKIKSGPGVIYLTQVTSAKAQKGTGILSVASDLLGNSIKPLTIIDNLKSYFEKIPYDIVRFKAERKDNFDINLQELLIQNSELYITGQGQIKNNANVAILEQPLNMPVRLDAKGNAAQLLKQLGLLSDKQNAQGYFIGPTFIIKGTLANPNWDNFWDVLLKASTNILLPVQSLSGQDDASNTIKNIPAQAAQQILNIFKSK